MKVSDLTVGDRVALTVTWGHYPAGTRVLVALVSRDASGQYRLKLRDPAALGWSLETFHVDGDEDL